MNTKYMLLAGAVILLLLTGAVFLLNSNKKTSSINTSTPQSQTQTEASPTPSEAPTQVMAGESKIELTASGFSPENVTIKKGTKVVWTNNSGKTATVNSNPHPVHTSFPEMNLGSFNDGETLELIFNKSGTYNYHNHFNASVGGTITVEE